MSEQSEAASQGAEQPQDNLYHFNPEEFDSETESIVNEFKERWIDNAKSPESKDFWSRRLDEDIKERQQLREWSEKYSGKIPQGWGGPGAWQHMNRDMESGDPLSDELFDAVIEFPGAGWPRETLGLSRQLTDAQLERVLGSEMNVGSYGMIRRTQEAFRRGETPPSPFIIRKLDGAGPRAGSFGPGAKK